VFDTGVFTLLNYGTGGGNIVLLIQNEFRWFRYRGDVHDKGDDNDEKKPEPIPRYQPVEFFPYFHVHQLLKR
jgi:hypothetical protein